MMSNVMVNVVVIHIPMWINLVVFGSVGLIILAIIIRRLTR
jgi:hypothetical protein